MNTHFSCNAFLHISKRGVRQQTVKCKQGALMYMLKGLVKEHFLEVCFDQDVKRQYRCALVKKKGVRIKGK